MSRDRMQARSALVRVAPNAAASRTHRRHLFAAIIDSIAGDETLELVTTAIRSIPADERRALLDAELAALDATEVAS